jgi:hypothetical protein
MRGWSPPLPADIASPKPKSAQPRGQPEILTERRARLEATIAALEEEQAGLLAHLKARVLSVEQLQTIQEFGTKVSEHLEAMRDDFEMKRRLVEELDVCVTRAVEDGQKVIYARCLLGGDVFLTSNTIQGIVQSLWLRSMALTVPLICL